MREVNNAPRAANKSRAPRTRARLSYQNLAGDLAEEMAASVSSQERREFSAPFELVIVDSRGAVVFECEISEEWKVSHGGPARIVRRSHFPATALLTDRSLLTKTFQIERVA
jgi:hypothetical protein